MIHYKKVFQQGEIMPIVDEAGSFQKKEEECMKKYEALEIEVKAILVSDIISTSPTDIGQDTPGIGLDDDMLS